MGGDFPVPYIHILWANLNKPWAFVLGWRGGRGSPGVGYDMIRLVGWRCGEGKKEGRKFNFLFFFGVCVCVCINYYIIKLHNEKINR